jgi:hypothetical protein
MGRGAVEVQQWRRGASIPEKSFSKQQFKVACQRTHPHIFMIPPQVHWRRLGRIALYPLLSDKLEVQLGLHHAAKCLAHDCTQVVQDEAEGKRRVDLVRLAGVRGAGRAGWCMRAGTHSFQTCCSGMDGKQAGASMCCWCCWHCHKHGQEQGRGSRRHLWPMDNDIGMTATKEGGR